VLQSAKLKRRLTDKGIRKIFLGEKISIFGSFGG
jgi:hypothetical protein